MLPLDLLERLKVASIQVLRKIKLLFEYLWPAFHCLVDSGGSEITGELKHVVCNKFTWDSVFFLPKLVKYASNKLCTYCVVMVNIYFVLQVVQKFG